MAIVYRVQNQLTGLFYAGPRGYGGNKRLHWDEVGKIFAKRNWAQSAITTHKGDYEEMKCAEVKSYLLIENTGGLK